LAHATARGRRPIAVVAGHMHWRLRGGGLRRWMLERDGVVFVNAACVPRIFEAEAGTVHHHVELRLGVAGFTAKEVLVPRA
ncbi:MAG: hypothetical protein M3020_20045, partial [Myxococcota bacterium]|nr:hypothetical protein [Myxococcota bacterium]